MLLGPAEWQSAESSKTPSKGLRGRIVFIRDRRQTRPESGPESVHGGFMAFHGFETFRTQVSGVRDQVSGLFGVSEVPNLPRSEAVAKDPSCQTFLSTNRG